MSKLQYWKAAVDRTVFRDRPWDSASAHVFTTFTCPAFLTALLFSSSCRITSSIPHRWERMAYGGGSSPKYSSLSVVVFSKRISKSLLHD